jgi:hypothetical protein
MVALLLGWKFCIFSTAELDCPASLMVDLAQMNGCAAERNPGPV